VKEIAEKSGDAAAIVEAVVALGHSLKLTVIAEGVNSRIRWIFCTTASVMNYRATSSAVPSHPRPWKNCSAKE